MYDMITVDQKVAELVAAGHSAPEIIQKIAPMTLGWPYVFGAWGEQCTPANRRKRARADHPTIVTKCQVLNGNKANCDGCKWYLPVRQYDCRGYTHWLLDKVGIPLKGSGCTSQYNDNDNWESKGLIADMPKGKVCCVFKYKDGKYQHTGMYMGDGDTIYDCSSGVEKHSIQNKAWTHFGIPKGLYAVSVPDEPKEEEQPTLRRGSKGKWVTLAQTQLNNRGYDLGSCGVDGDFGKATEAAVKLFQQDWGLVADGIIGPETWEKLYSTIERQRLVTLHIPHLTPPQAEGLINRYSGAWMTEE